MEFGYWFGTPASTKGRAGFKASLFASLAALFLSAATVAQEDAPRLTCPEQPGEVVPGVYASSIQKTITFSKDGQTLDFNAGTTGYADDSRLTCLEETPEFIRRDRLPAPGDFGALAGACGFSGGGGGGGGDDFGLASEWPRMERGYAEEVERFVKDGYPPRSIILHAIASGLTMDKAIYLMTRADSDRAAEFFSAAFAMQDSVPGWACSASAPSKRGSPFSPYYGVNDLAPRRTVAEVASRFFEQSQVMEPAPNWIGNDFHMLAYTEELVQLASDQYWYQRNGRSAVENGRLTKPILISLYGEPQQIVLDISREDLVKFQEQGVERLPVVFYFNKDFQRPVTDPRNEPTVSSVIKTFENEQVELTPVPWLAGGDFHLVVPLTDLEPWFEIPAKEDIDPARYAELADDLQRNGYRNEPVVATLYSEQNGRWLNDPERVRVALDLGIQDAPMAFLYHRLGRLPCGAGSSNCVRRVCAALTCAGGAPSSCDVEPAIRGESEEQSEPPPPPAAAGGLASPS